jgi:hypothetical protein
MPPLACMIQNHTIQGFYFQPTSYPCPAQTCYSMKIVDGSFYTHLIAHVVCLLLPHLEDVIEVGIPNEILNIMWSSSSNNFSFLFHFPFSLFLCLIIIAQI